MWTGSRLVYDDIQGPAVVFHSCHLHVLEGARKEIHGVSKDQSLELRSGTDTRAIFEEQLR